MTHSPKNTPVELTDDALDAAEGGATKLTAAEGDESTAAKKPKIHNKTLSYVMS